MNLIIGGILSTVLLTSILYTAEYTAIYDDDISSVVVIEQTIWQEDELKEYVTNEAIKHNVDVNLALRIMDCEAPWKHGESGRYYDVNDSQSRLKYSDGQISRNPEWGIVGEREKSYGIWQYHLPAHNLTIEEASSVEISTAKAIQDLKTRPSQWTCYK